MLLKKAGIESRVAADLRWSAVTPEEYLVSAGKLGERHNINGDRQRDCSENKGSSMAEQQESEKKHSEWINGAAMATKDRGLHSSVPQISGLGKEQTHLHREGAKDGSIPIPCISTDKVISQVQMQIPVSAILSPIALSKT